MPSDVRFANIRRILDSHGWTLNRITGSHHIFAKPGEERLINLPVLNGRVKASYLARVTKEHKIEFRG